MRQQIRLAPFVALALGAALLLGGCQPKPAATSPNQAAQATPTPAAPTPEAPPGGVDVALAAIKWPDGPVVARVNGTDIKTDTWRDEVTRQLRVVTAQYLVDWNDQANVAHLPEIEDTVLDRMVSLELLRQLAAKEGVTVSDEDVQKAATNAEQQITSSGQYTSIADYLKANELTQEQYDALIREQAMIDKMVAAHGGPTEMEQVHARHILVSDEATAKEVLAKLAANQSFEELAKTYSIDTGTKDQGGDLGWFPRGAMVQEFEEAAFALQAGQTSGVVQTVYGYHIIRVEERGVRKLEEPMLTQVQQQVFSDWLDEQTKAAKIERLFQASPTPAPTTPAPAVPTAKP